MITEDYVNFETAKLLKEKGFNEEVKTFYSYDTEFKIYDFQEDDRWDTPNNWGENYWSVPTLQMAMKWLREVHNIEIVITPSMFWGRYNVSIYKRNNNCPFGFDGDSLISSYKEACEAAIKYCLENLI